MIKKNISIAIHQNESMFRHSTMWDPVWVNYCEKNNINYKIIDCFKPGIVEELRNFDGILWHMGNFAPHILEMGQSFVYTSERLGLKVFPDFNTVWHYDNKITEAVLLQSIGAPLPKSWSFFQLEDCIEWLNSKAEYPLVAKLKCGAGSNNVKLIRTKSEGIHYAKRMFKKGFKPTPNTTFKAMSNLKSSRDWSTIKARLKRIPDFIQSVSGAKRFQSERDYVLFQEFIPNDGFDLKVVVIGDKLSFIVRNVRKGDFRASGGGDLFYDKSFITKDIINSAFETSDKLNFQCMGYDYVIDKNDGVGKIIEMSYAFSHKAILEAGGYFDRNGIWHDEPLNAPEEIIKNLLEGM